MTGKWPQSIRVALRGSLLRFYLWRFLAASLTLVLGLRGHKLGRLRCGGRVESRVYLASVDKRHEVQSTYLGQLGSLVSPCSSG